MGDRRLLPRIQVSPGSKPLSLSRRFPETPTGLPLTMGRASPHPARPR